MRAAILIVAAPVWGSTASDTAAMPSLISAAPVSASASTTPSDTPTPILPPVMAPGSACLEGDNGEWNCLSSCWQRCAAGFWSDTMALAPGTRCIPLGLSFDLQIVNAVAATASTANLSNSTLATLSDATCVCSTTACTVLSPSASSSAPSLAPSPSSSTTNGAGFKSGHSSGGSSFAADAVAVGVALLGGCAVVLLCC